MTRGKPMASNCRRAIAPLVSVSSAWSTARPISSPAAGLPETRWRSISFRVRLRPTRTPPRRDASAPGAALALLQGDERAAGRALVVGAGTDQAVVGVLLEE